MNNPHKHAEVIHAIADGIMVQFKRGSNWVDFDSNKYYSPIESPELQWRIKSETKPDVVRYLILTEGSGYASLQSFCNAVITIDGETGKLKSVEVLE